MTSNLFILFSFGGETLDQECEIRELDLGVLFKKFMRVRIRQIRNQMRDFIFKLP